MAEHDQKTPIPETIELPAPTAWPMVAAFGLTLGFAGLVTSVFVTLLGIAAFVIGAVGWWYDIFPVERHEAVPVAPPEQRAAAVVPAPHRVEHLVAGVGRHRLRLPVEVHPYSAGIKGGIVGGAAMAIVACAYGQYAYGSIWYPINLLAATAMPSMARADLAELKVFQFFPFVIAFVSHGVLSVFVGVLFAAMLPMLPRQSMFWGAFTAPIFWTGLIYASLRWLNPTLNDRIDWWGFIASQMAFGLTTGFVISRSDWVKTRQSASLLERAGIEGSGLEE